MFIEILKSKIHRAFVTEVNINYQGSITIDEDLMDAANIVEHEKVQVLNYNNGERIDTYVIKGKRGTGSGYSIAIKIDRINNAAFLWKKTGVPIKAARLLWMERKAAQKKTFDFKKRHSRPQTAGECLLINCKTFSP